MRCNQCGTEFKGNYCPKCGARAGTMVSPVSSQPTWANQPFYPQNSQAVPNAKGTKKLKVKPFYKKWWFFILLAIVVIVIISSIVRRNRSKYERISWNNIVMGEIIPEPKSNNREFRSNSDKYFSASIDKMSNLDYADYVAQCKEKGFNVDVETNSSSFKAYNASGYKLRLSYYNYSSGNMNIDLDAPIKMAEIQWPSSIAGQLIPAPKSTTGKFSYEYDKSFFAYIGNTTMADYGEYVSACIERGFNVDYTKGDTYYYADNSDGYNISLRYEGNNTMTVSIESPDSSKSPNVNPQPVETKMSVSETATINAPMPEPTIAPVTPIPAPTTAPAVPAAPVSGIRADFKATLDSYEAFFDKYCAFMKKYQDEGNPITMLADYASMMAQYLDMMNKMDAMKTDDLTNEELAYYVEVNSRITQKLIMVSP